MTRKNHSRRSTVRDYMARHGVTYTQALRALESLDTPEGQADRAAAHVIWTAPRPDGVARVMKVEVDIDDPRHPGPWSFWAYPNARPPSTSVESELSTRGWQLAAAPEWPSFETAGSADLDLVRNDLGRRNDEAEVVLSAAGLDYHGAHEPYLAAVAYELTRAGIDWEDWNADANEPRDGAIQLSDPLDWDELYISWNEERGWFAVPFSDREQSLGDCTQDLGVGRLAEPHEVARAVRELIGGPAADAEPMWRPPDGYDPSALPADEWWDASPAFETALAAYATHPAWTRTPRCQACRYNAAHYVITRIRAGGTEETLLVCAPCDAENTTSRRRVQPADLADRP